MDHESRIKKLEQDIEAAFKRLNDLTQSVTDAFRSTEKRMGTLEDNERHMRQTLHTINNRLNPIALETPQQTQMLQEIQGQLGIVKEFWPKFWSRCFWTCLPTIFALIVAGIGTLVWMGKFQR